MTWTLVFAQAVHPPPTVCDWAEPGSWQWYLGGCFIWTSNEWAFVGASVLLAGVAGVALWSARQRS